jgi:hypothetical protein
MKTNNRYFRVNNQKKNLIDKLGATIDMLGNSFDKLGEFVDIMGETIDKLGLNRAVNTLYITTYKRLNYIYYFKQNTTTKKSSFFNLNFKSL